MPASKFTVHITNRETGFPVTNAIVKTEFEHKYDPWDGDNIVDHKKERVDTNGMVMFFGQDIGGSFGATVRAEGYYQDWAGLEHREKNLVLNRWEPWDPTFEIKMRPKKNPVPMIKKYLENKPIPVFDQSVGFDLETFNWIAPYGKGKISDFIFSATFVTQPKEGIQYSLRFSNELDGLQEYVPPENLSSEYIFPYDAPTNGYVAEFNRYRLLKYPVLPDYPANNLKDDKNINYIFRVRTEVDDDGNIVSAHYGRIRWEIRATMKGGLYFSYWFNPEPNNRSLESDEKPY